MTIYTDKLNDGTLEEGFYYIRLKKGGVHIAELEQWYAYNPQKGKTECKGIEFSGFDTVRIEEVIAPVPNYDLFVELNEKVETLSSKNKYLSDLLGNWDKEVEQLRQLLKECKNIVAHDCWQEAQFPDGQVVQRQSLLNRINEVLK